MSDFDRPLNKRGKFDAPLMGEILTLKSIVPDIIISSPAKRAKTTAKLIAKKIGYEKEIEFNENIYEASSMTLFYIIKSIDDKFNSAFLIGHNPSLSFIADELVNFYQNLPTCGVLEIEFETEKWSEISKQNATLISFEYPKLYKHH